MQKFEEILPWAKGMAKMLCRQPSIARVTGLSSSTVRKLWLSENGRSSPSGMTPSDIDWYLRTADIRYQSALLVMLFADAKKTYPPEVAFTNAYFHFSNMTSGEWARRRSSGGAFRDSEDDYVLNFARGHYLVSVYTDEASQTKQRLCDLKIRRCKGCGGIYMSHVNEVSGRCPNCATGANKNGK